MLFHCAEEWAEVWPLAAVLSLQLSQNSGDADCSSYPSRMLIRLSMLGEFAKKLSRRKSPSEQDIDMKSDLFKKINDPKISSTNQQKAYHKPEP